jgi:hypothetical protein
VNLLTKVGGDFAHFGAVGECDKGAYAPSPTAHNTFLPTSWAKKKNYKHSSMVAICFVRNILKNCLFSFTGPFQSCIFFQGLLNSFSAVGECAE